MNIYYNSDYTSSSYKFDTTRKSAEVANWLNTNNHPTSDPSSYYTQTEATLAEVHSPAYINAVKTGNPYALAESQGFEWDPKIYTMALAHSAGLVAATHDVLSDNQKVAGSLSSGLHHAGIDAGAGFCTFNGIAVAAKTAYDLGARRILCLDFDAHCGGGTYEMTRDIDMCQVDVYTDNFDLYNINDEQSKLFKASDTTAYLDYIEAALAYADRLGGWDFIIYNAGVDPYNSGVSKADLFEREQMVADFVSSNQTPAIFALAGGYTWGGVTMDELVQLHTATAVELARV